MWRTLPFFQALPALKRHPFMQDCLLETSTIAQFEGKDAFH
jgi:hypothetical protein